MADFSSNSGLGLSMMLSSSTYKTLYPEHSKKADPRFVRLQQIEHGLKENELLSHCLYAAVVSFRFLYNKMICSSSNIIMLIELLICLDRSISKLFAYHYWF